MRLTRNPFRQCLAADEFHHDERAGALRLEPIEVRDVRVIERREDARLALETDHPIGIGGERIRKDLDGDAAVQLRVLCAIDLAHSARAKGRPDLVRSESSPWLQWHG